MPLDRREWPPGIVRVHWHPCCCDLKPRRLRARFRAKFFYCHPERREGSHKSWLITQSSLDVPAAVVRSLASVRDDDQELLEHNHGIPFAHQILHPHALPFPAPNATVSYCPSNY